MSGDLTEKERRVARKWRDAANEEDIGPVGVMKIATMLLSVLIIKVSKNREDAAEGIRALTGDLNRQADKRWPDKTIDLDRRTPDSPWEKP